MRRWRYPRNRRGRFFDYPKVIPVAPPRAPDRLARRRRAAFTVRRGEFWNRVPAQVVVTPPAYVPQFSTTERSRSRPIRRGRFFTRVPAQVVVAPPSYPPTFMMAERGRARRTRRGRFFGVVATPAVPVVSSRVPDRISRRRVTPVYRCRTRFFGFPRQFIPFRDLVISRVARPGVSWAAVGPAGASWGNTLEKGVWAVRMPYSAFETTEPHNE